MGYVPLAADLKKTSVVAQPESENDRDGDVSAALFAQCEYVRNVADTALRSIDDMVSICAAVYRETVDCFGEE